MKKENKDNQTTLFKKEDEISELIYLKIKKEKISDSELERIILKEVENNLSFSEDWQKHYTEKRIKERVKEKESENEYKFVPTTSTKRFLNLILDWIGISVFLFILGIVLGLFGLDFIIENINEWILGSIIIISYYLFFEYFWYKTPAKFITNTKVITKHGETPDFRAIIVRTLTRLVPFEPFSFLSPHRPIGWHDKWSNTIVVDEFKNFSNVEKIKPFYCSKCGEKISQNSNFCFKCRKKFN